MRMPIRLLIASTLTGALALACLVLGVPRADAENAAPTNPTTFDREVHRRLVTLPWYSVFDNLEYQIDGSEVILSGQVVGEHGQTKYDAENAVKRIAGVTKVVNNIEILPPSQFDNQIRRAEYRSIFSQFGLGRYTLGTIPQIHIIVRNGHVTLEGVVMNQMDKNIAGIVANTVPNVFSVTNNLRIG